MHKLALVSTAALMLAFVGSSSAQTQKTTTTPSTPTTTTTSTTSTTSTMTAPAGAATYYTAQTADMRASKLIGTDVYNTKNENIGEIEDILLGKTHSVQAFVVSVGGFLGVGERHVAVKPESLTLMKQSDGTFRVVINADKAGLQKAPEFNTEATGSIQ